MKKMYRKIQLLSHLATIVIAVLLGVIVVKQYILPNSQAQDDKSTQTSAKVANPSTMPSNIETKINPVGKTVPLQEIDWKENKNTLVLYLSNTCGYCTSSGPFYQELVRKNSENKIKLVTVLPQSVDEGAQYLKKLGIDIKDIYSSRLTEIGVSATPTLLLVNEEGVVSEMWRGKLSPEKESQLLKRLFG